jgi:hypothetical protein
LKMRVKRACDRQRERWERIKHDGLGSTSVR